jgi:alpha-mannosidase
MGRGSTLRLPFVVVCLAAMLASGDRRSPLLAQAPPPPPGGCAELAERARGVTVLPLPDWRFQPGETSQGEAAGLDDSRWQTLRVGEPWKTGRGWFRRSIEIPPAIGGYDVRGARVRLRFILSGDDDIHKSIHVNGVSIAGADDLSRIVIAERAEPGTSLLVAVNVRMAAATPATLREAQLEFEPLGRPDPRMLAAECQVGELLAAAEAGAQAQYAAALQAAAGAVDWTALTRGDQQAFDRSLKQAHELLQPLAQQEKRSTIRADGNAHIDMAWLWPWTETVEVVRNTFTDVLELMREYPDFVFTQSQAQTYAWIEEKYPQLFEQIRQRVHEGRWEPIGGMWVEPDLNLPDGESLVRQVLVGKRYFKEKFGVEIRTGWNPDSFGYNWQLPQIYKKSGIDFFVTQKISWNETTRFPHKLFWWQAPDGSRLLTYFPHGYANSIDPARMARDLAEYAPATGYPEMMYLYGVGDHGGGPTREMLDAAHRWQAADAAYPRLFFGAAQPYFDALAAKAASLKIPIWNDELYLEYHRGTYTTQAETKKNNRTSERMMLDAEKWSSIAHLLGRAYPQRDLETAWKKVLFNQFHDILPGSAVAAVYRDASRDHAEVQRAAGDIAADALAAVAAYVKTDGGGIPVLVFNPLSWPRTDVVEADVQFPQSTRTVDVRDPQGRPALADVVSRDPASTVVRVRFLADEVPGVGYKVFHVSSRQVVASRKAAAGAAAQGKKPWASLVIAGTTIENEFLRVRVDPATGCITSLFDKAHSREVLAPSACGNLLQAFADKPRDWDAWNIDASFEDKKWDLAKADEVKVVEQTALRVSVRVVKTFQQSSFTQLLSLSPGVARLDVRTQADWHEKHILIKAAFPLAVKSEVATFEIPYGSIQRPTTRRTPEEKAKFEVPALRWADLSDQSGGMSLLNDSKYGYDAKDNVLRISLLRAPEWPDPTADQGAHQFTYSLYPHAGGWKDAATVRRGYELNYPLTAMAVTPHSGQLPATHSFVELTPDSVVLTAMKKCEDDDAVLVRFYEWAGRQSDVRLKLAANATRAVETDLLEREQKELPVTAGVITIPTGPYEIKAVKVRFGRPAIIQAEAPAGPSKTAKGAKRTGKTRSSAKRRR